MKDPDATPISVQLLWLLALMRVAIVVLALGFTIWLALPEPSNEWLREFRTSYTETAGLSGPVLTPEEFGAFIGANTIPWVLVLLLPLALKKRSLSGVRWILGISALVAVTSAPLGLILIGVMFGLTLPKAGWRYWYAAERAAAQPPAGG